MRPKAIVISTAIASAIGAAAIGTFYVINLNIKLPPMPSFSAPPVQVVVQPAPDKTAAMEEERRQVIKSFDDVMAIYKAKGLIN